MENRTILSIDDIARLIRCADSARRNLGEIKEDRNKYEVSQLAMLAAGKLDIIKGELEIIKRAMEEIAEELNGSESTIAKDGGVTENYKEVNNENFLVDGFMEQFSKSIEKATEE